MLLERAAALVVAEGRPGGYEAAQALALVLQQDPQAGPAGIPPPLARLPYQALRGARSPLARAARAAVPLLDWQCFGLDNGKISPEIAGAMLTAEIIGPDGSFFHPTVRVGLFVQAAGVAYRTRTHPAEETFYMIGGEGFWRQGGGAERRAVAGEVIHHPSMTPHSSTTRLVPLVALWRWTGDIDAEGYELSA